MPEKKLAIFQSNYIPWKGFFNIIDIVDEFVFYDDVQYTKNDWRNRNIIKTPDGQQWLTVPVLYKNKFGQKIMDTRINGMHWKKKHLKSIIQNYKKAPCYEQTIEFISRMYQEIQSDFLCDINYHTCREICNFIGIQTPFKYSFDFNLPQDRNERLLDLCKQLNATHFINGPRAKSYLDEDMFSQNGVTVVYMDYSGYPEYPQLFPPFLHQVSVIDLILNTGKEAKAYMKETIPGFRSSNE